MSTKLAKQMTYDAPAEAVAAMLDDVAFREEVLERQKVLRGSATVDGDLVTIEQVRSGDDLPSFARKFVGDEITIVQRETWTSPASCDVELAIPGKPGEAVGTMRLVESGGDDHRGRRPRPHRPHPARRREDRGPHRRAVLRGARHRAPRRCGVAQPLTSSPSATSSLLRRHTTSPSTTNGPNARSSVNACS